MKTSVLSTNPVCLKNTSINGIRVNKHKDKDNLHHYIENSSIGSMCRMDNSSIKVVVLNHSQKEPKIYVEEVLDEVPVDDVNAVNSDKLEVVSTENDGMTLDIVDSINGTISDSFVSSKSISFESSKSISFESSKSSGEISSESIMNLTSTGKEMIDRIDGIEFITFETESDMLEFTTLEKAQTLKNDCCIDHECTKQNIVARIVPTKTHDITQIKGWRNKFFYSETSQNEATKDIHNNDNANLDSNVKDSDHDNPDSTVKYKRNKSILNNLAAFYMYNLHKDEVYMHLTSNKKNKKDSVEIFVSRTLDDYLSNYSLLSISFELPTLFSETPTVEDSKIGIIKVKEEVTSVNNSPDDSNNNSAQTKNTCIDSCEDFIAARNLKKKYIWVQGRPIMIENDRNEEVIKEPRKNRKRFCDFGNDSQSENSDPEFNPGRYNKRILHKTNNSSPVEIKIEDEATPNDMSLNEEADIYEPFVDHHYTPKRPHLSLLKTIKKEEDIEIRYECPPKPLGKTKTKTFPVISPCNHLNEDHLQCSNFKELKLGMVLNVGYHRPLPDEVIQNFEQLKTDSVTIDSRWAEVAASAIRHRKNMLSRFLVPVVSKPLVDLMNKHIEVKINCDKSGPEAQKIEIDVKQVVGDIVAYVENKAKYDEVSNEYDPDIPSFAPTKKKILKKSTKSKVERELKRLINVSLVDEKSSDTSSNGGHCSNDFCLKGCVCNSLNGKLPVLHCGKAECMFDCSCKFNENFPNGSFTTFNGRKKRLAREESKWHQTVIRKNNQVIEIKAINGKSKREKKLPTRFRTNVLLGKEMNCLDLSLYQYKPINHPNKNSTSQTKKTPESQMNKSSESHMNKTIGTKLNKINANQTNKIIGNQKNNITGNLINKSMGVQTNKNMGNQKNNSKNKEPINKEVIKKDSAKKKPPNPSDFFLPQPQILSKLDMKKIEKICCDDLNTELCLSDMCVWCSIHSRYSCTCSGLVYMLKNNQLVWKPTPDQPYLTNKDMTSISINNLVLNKVHISDRANHSARTSGSLFNYSLRNSSPFFKFKRQNEIENDVLSNTNSFIRINYSKLHYSNFKNGVPRVKNVSLLKLNSTYEIYSPTTYKSRAAVSRNKQIDKNLFYEHVENLPIFDGEFPENCDPFMECIDVDNYNDDYNDPLCPETILIEDDSGDVFSKANSDCSQSVVVNDDTASESQIKPRIINSKVKNVISPRLNAITIEKSRNLTNITRNSQSMPRLSISQSLQNMAGTIDKKPMKVTRMANNESNDTAKQRRNRKRYRIGPAHFESMGSSYRSIVSRENTNTSNNTSKMTEVAPKPVETKVYFQETHLNMTELIEFQPRYGLLCLTQGFGYLPIKEYTPKKLMVQDPLSNNIFHTFKDLESANKWLNRFFKNRIIFEDLDFNLNWVIVKPGILQQSKPFDKNVLGRPSQIVTRDGILIEKSVHMYQKKKQELSSFGGDVTSETLNKRDVKSEPKIIKRSLESDGDKDNICNTDSTVKKIKIDRLSVVGGGKVQRISTEMFQKLQLSEKKPDVPLNIVHNDSSTSYLRIESGSSPSISEGRFIPLVFTSKEAKHNVNSLNKSESSEYSSNISDQDKHELSIKDSSILNKMPLDSVIAAGSIRNPLNRPNPSSDAVLLNQKFLKKNGVIIGRIAENVSAKKSISINKNIPLNIKSLPAMSILKTNFKT